MFGEDVTAAQETLRFMDFFRTAGSCVSPSTFLGSRAPFMSNRYQSHDWPSLILDNSRLLASPSIIGGQSTGHRIGDEEVSGETKGVTSPSGSGCNVRTQDPENFDEEVKSLVTAWRMVRSLVTPDGLSFKKRW